MSAEPGFSRARRVLAAALGLLLASASPAFADHCGSLMDCALTSGGFLGAAAGLSVALLGLGLFNQLLAPRIAGSQAGRTAASEIARAQQAQQAANEKAANDAAKSGAPPPSPGAEKVGAEIAGLKATIAGVNPSADLPNPKDLARGRVNCQGVSTAVDDRLAGRGTDVVAPDFVNDAGQSTIPTVGQDASDMVGSGMRDAVGNGNDWQEMTPEQIEEALRTTPGRGIVYVQWAGGGAHVLNTVSVDGDVFYVDGQPSQPAVSSTLDGLYGAKSAGGVHDVKFLRTWPPK